MQSDAEARKNLINTKDPGSQRLFAYMEDGVWAKHFSWNRHSQDLSPLGLRELKEARHDEEAQKAF